MESMIKKLTTFFILALAMISFSFADSINGFSDAVLLMLPRTVTYSKGDAIEMTTAKALTTSDLGNEPLTFSSSLTNNLGILRFQENLHNMYLSIPSWNGYTYNSYRNADMFQTNNSVVLEIETSGLFVNVDDPTIVRDFTLSCFLTEAYIKKDGSEYVKLSGFPKEMTLGETITLSDTVSTTYFKNTGGSDYELYLPSSPIVSSSSTKAYYPLLMRIFDLCIVLPDTEETLPSGYYKTEITITSVGSYKNRSFSGTRTYDEEERTYIIETSTTELTMSETITVWGYVGSTSGESSSFSFSIAPSSDSYSMDLGDTDTYYSVTSVNFYTVNGPYTSNSAPSTSTQASKYKIYISPVADYTTSGTYQFTKVNGTEVVPYDIYLDSSGTTFASNSSTSVGGSGAGGGSLPSSTYYILPNYTYSTEKLKNTTKYTETWRISSLPIYLKVNEETNVTHTAGEYKSNLYFTVVSD